MDGYYHDGDRLGPIDLNPDSPERAALSVAFLLGIATVFLLILKKSGFRAMVAVGRGT